MPTWVKSEGIRIMMRPNTCLKYGTIIRTYKHLYETKFQSVVIVINKHSIKMTQCHFSQAKLALTVRVRKLIKSGRAGDLVPFPWIPPIYICIFLLLLFLFLPSVNLSSTTLTSLPASVP